MTSIKIEPAGPRDLAMHRAQYDELLVALHDAGYEAEIDLLEKRAVLPFSPDILIHVGEAGATAKGLFDITQLLRRIMRRLRRPPSGEPRRAVIYGPNGEVLKTVELPDDASESCLTTWTATQIGAFVVQPHRCVLGRRTARRHLAVLLLRARRNMVRYRRLPPRAVIRPSRRAERGQGIDTVAENEPDVKFSDAGFGPGSGMPRLWART